MFNIFATLFGIFGGSKSKITYLNQLLLVKSQYVINLPAAISHDSCAAPSPMFETKSWWTVPRFVPHPYRSQFPGPNLKWFDPKMWVIDGDNPHMIQWNGVIPNHLHSLEIYPQLPGSPYPSGSPKPWPSFKCATVSISMVSLAPGRKSAGVAAADALRSHL